MTKLFIGGLPNVATTPEVRDYFAQFGPLSDAVCMEGRGFGFVTYENPDNAMEVLSMEHVMGDRRLDLKEATVEGTKGAPQKGGKGGGGGGGGYGGKAAFAAPMQRYAPPMQQYAPPAYAPPAYGGGPGPGAYAGGGGGKSFGKGGGGKGKGGGAGPKTDKIFVGGLPADCMDDALREHFQAYGELVDCVVMKEKGTGKPRGFGFVQYDNTDSADAVMQDFDAHTIDGKWIECKRATPQDKMAPAMPKGGGKSFGGGGGYGGGGCYGAPQPQPYGGCYGAPPPQAYGGCYGAPQPQGYGPAFGGGKGKGGYSPYK